VPVATASAAEVQPSQRIAAWFSETKRTGPWTPARENLVRSVFATVRLDLREARLGPGTTHFAMDVFMGEVEVIVPPGLPIDIDCSVVFAEVDQDDAVEPGAPTDARIHIGGRVWFGSVKIREMLPGETRSEARKRRKAARKRLSEAKRKALGPAR
jgi:predicted membrane protein